MNRQPNRARRNRAHAIARHLLAAGVASALCLGAARAGTPVTLDFESVTNVVSGTLAPGDTVHNSYDACYRAGFRVQVRNSATAAAHDHGLVGARIDGGDPFGCLLAARPAHDSRYFAGLNDGALALSRNDHLAFTVDAVRFAFIGLTESGPVQLSLTGTLAGGGTL
ncbi:hypothetical protein CR105_12640 [Massilia eurypsychrophila]|uniref:Uncharacterized protein n=1 Tax=Massilia eurypsychrophila TaxID=1485217 RepID=A0A2G8TFG6_9BURK|nr:hypothetical protein [Massilia eurypsychrophila]PIL44753.1 hypothetical protein CR105_12640 [Massilia eurypsychrophila]